MVDSRPILYSLHDLVTRVTIHIDIPDKNAIRQLETAQKTVHKTCDQNIYSGTDVIEQAKEVFLRTHVGKKNYCRVIKFPGFNMYLFDAVHCYWKQR